MILLPPADMSTPFHRQTKLSVHEYHFEKGTHTETVDPEVVPVVLPQDLDLAGPLAEVEAVQKEDKLHA